MSKLEKRIYELIEDEKLKEELGNEIIYWMKHELSQYPCIHGTGKHASTPPMFFPELLGCIISKARMDGIQAGINATVSLDRNIEEINVEDPTHISFDEAKKIWDTFGPPSLTEKRDEKEKEGS